MENCSYICNIILTFLGKEIFRLLVHSLCPPIYGHEMVKAGLLLALFGGTSKFSNDKDNVAVRGDPHILIVGDPGLGKSQMLTASHHVAPRSVFVTATGASNTGNFLSIPAMGLIIFFLLD